MDNVKKYGVGWIPDYPDFRDYTEKTEEVKTILGPKGVLKAKSLPVSNAFLDILLLFSYI